ncbi:MAG: DUF58 domain-containing protein [Oscillospiraceae bacterium]|nr:DUF58 domain-containing protein [Oscillospiraceae bacterium]
MPTVNFFLYLLYLALVFYFRAAYIGWFGQYVLLSFALIPLLLTLLSLPSMLRSSVSLTTAGKLTKGAKAELLLDLHVPTLLPVRYLTVTIEIENRYTGGRMQDKVRYPMVMNGSRAIELPTDSCGQLVCKVLRLECRDVLGLISIRRKCPEPLVCTVLPEPIGPEVPIDLDAALDTAQHLIPKYGGGFSEEHELREYQPGDTINSIHWKLSSKTDEVIVREPMVPRDKDVFLVLSHAGKDDRGLELLYWLSLQLCEREIPHALVSDTIHDVVESADTVDALETILARPATGPKSFDPSTAKCIFLIHEGEVQLK